MSEFELSGAPVSQQLPHYQRYREMSIEDMLLENRIIFLAGPINERAASGVLMRMLYLESIKRESDIQLYIMAWPYMDEHALRVWEALRPGQYLLYFGESYGGCTITNLS